MGPSVASIVQSSSKHYKSMISMTQQNEILKGLVLEYIPNGVAILQYADDTILCLKMMRS